MHDRRRYPRIDIDFVTVEVYMEDTTRTELAEICPVVNLSLSGMRFNSDRQFSTEKLLRLTFILPESMIIIRVNATIVHIHESEPRKYSYGVNFDNLGPTQEQLINHFIQKTISDYEQNGENVSVSNPS